MPGGSKANRQEQAIAALLSATTLEQAAQASGISLATLKRWLKMPDFRAAYAEARHGILERTASLLLSATTAAVEVLERNLHGDKAADQIRAAKVILEHAMQSVELLDLAEQLEELKRTVEGILRNGTSRLVG